MAASVQSAEQRELSLVGKVEMRIALADSDSKLESTLKTYLAPLLLKLASEHVSVRNKVISICQHVNTRVKPESIQLPVAALIKQFKEQQSPLIRHFDLLYVQQGIDRLSAREKAELLPVVTAGFASSGSHASQIFHLFLRLLEYFTLPPRGSKEDHELRTAHGISDPDASSLAEWLGKLILFTSQKTTSPGLTAEDCDFLNVRGKTDTWSPAQGGLNLLRTKVLAARILASGLFNDAERFQPALSASADTASTVSDIGDDMMKRTMPGIDLEDEDLLNRLLGLYLGRSGAPRVAVPLRVKILGLLSKSSKSTSFANNIMSIVEDGVAPPDADGEDVIMSNGVTNRANIGRQATKLRTAVFVYINFVARYGSPDVLHTIAPRVVGRLRDFIENQGWPRVGGNEDLSSRGYAYEVIGLLLKAGPKDLLFENEHPTLELLRWLFASLAQDTSGNTIIVSIEESLSVTLNAITRIDMNDSERGVLEDLLVEQMVLSSDLKANQRLRSTRYVAVRFANRCLPFDSVKARWVDVLGIGAQDERMEVREESERGLSPYWYKMLKGSSGAGNQDPISFPDFIAVVDMFFTGRTIDQDREAMVIARRAREEHPHCFADMVAFARRILYHGALEQTSASARLDNDWERKLDAAAENEPAAREAIAKHMRSIVAIAERPLEILQAALLEETVAQSHGTRDDFLVQYLSLAPDALVSKLAAYVERLQPVLLSNQHAARMVAGHAFGILASHPAAPNSKDLVASLLDKIKTWKSAVGAQANQVHGAAVSLGFYFSRRYCRGLLALEDKAYSEFVAYLEEMTGTATDQLLKEAAFVAIGQLCMFQSIKLDSDQLKRFTDRIYEVAKTGNERAILCLGQLSMICPNDASSESSIGYIEKQLHQLHEIRQAEIHFSVGEAFSYLACGWQSGALATKLDIEGRRPPGAHDDRSGILERLTDRIIVDCANSKPSLKKAAVMWLLCLVQYCGQMSALQERLGKCQQAFKRCLGDRDELVQETASRGLGLVYEKGDRSLKDDLVRDLVSSFSSDKQSQLSGTVSADTQLFEPGALPTGDGSVSTYKDIMSLASEVGDSSLVYRFMSMASSNAIWSSRAAFGRFGLSNVLSDSSVDGYLAGNPKLYPKLFRYRFDPNPGVQRSMNDIWNALVKDSAATIDKYFDAIMEDLLGSILGKEWRVRQASCAAIAELVQGRPLEKYEEYLERIWDNCFKVLDDIKESVRAAATSLARTLTGILTRALEADHSSTKTASAMLKHVLPFLLSPSGMESSAKEVQVFAVQTLLEIVKKSNGKTLRPFIPELVERLIGLLSSLEPEAVNYIHLNASKYNLTEQKIDDMRLSSVRSSPIMEAIERCLDLLDDETMQQLQGRLENAMKTAVGLPSKVGASRILVSLSTRRSQVFKPCAGFFLKLIEKLVLDRNETVSSSYAAAAGYVARHASDKQILRLGTFAKGLYFNAEGDREGVTPRKSISSGELVYATSKHATDRFNGLAASFLPFVFVAKHDAHESVKEQFQNTWNDAVGGSRAVLLYLAEILELVKQHIESPQWALKHTAVRSVADAVLAVAASEKEISNDTAVIIWPVLEKALGGKTWEGKEVVLPAFVKFVESAKSFYEKQTTVAADIVKIAVREAKRNNATYRQHAIKSLGQIAAVRRDIDMSEAVRAVVGPLIDEMVQEKPNGQEKKDEAENHKSSERQDSILAACMEALFASINANKPGLNASIGATLREAIKIEQPAAAAIRKSTYAGVVDLFGEAEKTGMGGKVVLDAGGAQALSQLLFVSDAGGEAMRLLRADAVLRVAGSSAMPAGEMRGSVAGLMQEERSVNVRDRLAAAMAKLPSAPSH